MLRFSEKFPKDGTNKKVECYGLGEVQEQQETAQVLGDVVNSAVDTFLTTKVNDAENAKKVIEDCHELGIYQLGDFEAMQSAQNTINTYGKGSMLQLGIRAGTGLAQGLITHNSGAAMTGALSPFANLGIKHLTGDNQTANLIAHGALGAVEAKLTGTNALGGAMGAMTGEAIAQILADKVYHKNPNQLTEAEKETITTLSQFTAGATGGLIGNSSLGFASGAEIGKHAVENNFIETPLDLGSAVAGYGFWAYHKYIKDDQERADIYWKGVLVDTAATVTPFIPAVGFAGANAYVAMEDTYNDELNKHNGDPSQINTGKVVATGILAGAIKSPLGQGAGNGLITFVGDLQDGKNVSDAMQNGLKTGVATTVTGAIGNKVVSIPVNKLNSHLNPIWKKYETYAPNPNFPAITTFPKESKVPAGLGVVLEHGYEIVSPDIKNQVIDWFTPSQQNKDK